jgi:hypothetical protein
MFSIMRCHRCDRIFIYYGKSEHPNCPNVRCHTKTTKNERTLIPVIFSPYPEQTYLGGKAVVSIRAFDNELSLIADVYSRDTKCAITLTMDTHKLNILTADLLSSIPSDCISKKSKTQGVVIQSGKYPLKSKLITYLS